MLQIAEQSNKVEVKGSESVQDAVLKAEVQCTTNQPGVCSIDVWGRSSCAHALLPLSAFFCERTAVLTAAAEYIGDLRDKTGEHSLQHDHSLR